MLIRKPPVSFIIPVTEWPLTGGSLLPIMHDEQHFLWAAFISHHFKYGSGEVGGPVVAWTPGNPPFDSCSSDVVAFSSARSMIG